MYAGYGLASRTPNAGIQRKQKRCGQQAHSRLTKPQNTFDTKHAETVNAQPPLPSHWFIKSQTTRVQPSIDHPAGTVRSNCSTLLNHPPCPATVLSEYNVMTLF